MKDLAGLLSLGASTYLHPSSRACHISESEVQSLEGIIIVKYSCQKSIPSDLQSDQRPTSADKGYRHQ